MTKQEGSSGTSAASHGSSPSSLGPVGALGRVFPKHSPALPEAPHRSISSLAKSWRLKSEREAALIKI